MKPFDDYPHGGRIFIGKLSGSNCRHEYGLELQLKTGQTTCAYCDTNLIDTYEHWLMMSTDHVIPWSAKKIIPIPYEWIEDMSNIVLCCSACNGFNNRYTISKDTPCPITPDDFFKLRDEIFSLRKQDILKKHEGEKMFYNKKPWENK